MNRMSYHTGILWHMFPISKNILQIDSTTIVIKKFKIMNYYSLIPIRSDPHSSFTECSLHPLHKKSPHEMTPCIWLFCLISCLWSGAVLQSSLDFYHLDTLEACWPFVFVSWIFLKSPHDCIWVNFSCTEINVTVYTSHCTLRSGSWFRFIHY